MPIRPPHRPVRAQLTHTVPQAEPLLPLGAVQWGSGDTIGERKVSLVCLPIERSARRRLPSRGSLGPHFPTFAGTMRRYDCPLSLSGASLVARLPDTLPASVVRGVPRGLMVEWKPPTTPGLLVTRSPIPGMQQGDSWLSQVPECPLCRHAPLSDPGGVLCTRHIARRTAAFQPLDTVGFSTTIHFSGLHHAAYLFATPGFVRPFTGRHAGSLLTCWLDFSQVGLEPYYSHPLGNNNQFRGVTSSSKVSGLPWRDQWVVRLGTPLRLLIGSPRPPEIARSVGS